MPEHGVRGGADGEVCAMAGRCALQSSFVDKV